MPMKTNQTKAAEPETMWQRLKKFLTGPGEIELYRQAHPEAPPTEKPRTRPSPKSITRAEYGIRVMSRAKIFSAGGPIEGFHVLMAENSVKKELADEGIKMSMNGSMGCSSCDQSHGVKGAASEAGGHGRL